MTAKKPIDWSMQNKIHNRVDQNAKKNSIIWNKRDFNKVMDFKVCSLSTKMVTKINCQTELEY